MMDITIINAIKKFLIVLHVKGKKYVLYVIKIILL